MASERAHGTAKRYNHGPDEQEQPGKGCRCTPCTKAVSVARKRNRLAALQGRNLRRVDAAPVREHLLWLLEQGMTPLAMAREAGVAHSLLTRLVRGRTDTGKPMTRVLESNADAVLSILPGTASMLFVPVVGSQRRVRGLLRQGWPRKVIAERAGLAHQQVWRIATEDSINRITAATARRVQVATSRLWLRDPLAAGIEPWRVALACKRAAEAGWMPVGVWDDIDAPDAVPDLGEKTSRIDAIAENADELIRGQGYTPEHAAERLGVTVKYLYRARIQAGRLQSEAVDA